MKNGKVIGVVMMLSAVQAFQVGRLVGCERTGTRLSHSQSYNGFLWDDMTPERRERIAREESLQRRFATGKVLRSLRSDMKSLRENLMWATALNDEERIRDLTKAIKDGERMDPDCAYGKALRVIEEAKRSTKIENKKEIIRKWTKEAAEARSCIERFCFHGLWVGRFGREGEHELINVTYSGDELTATKVVGGKFVPRGELVFKVDLSPMNNSSTMEPITLKRETAEKLGVKELDRYRAEAQTIEGYPNSPKVTDGQFIIFEDSFSFVWLQERKHVIFERPSPERTLRLLRDTISMEDEQENIRQHLDRCFQMNATDFFEQRGHSDETEPFRRIKRVHELRDP